jgi:hypothetical protein
MPYIPRELNLVPNTDGDPTYRSAMLPFATYANPNGSGEHFGFAVPGAIQEPINALMRLFGTPSNPGTFTQGPDAPGNADDMRTLLFSMYGGNALNPAAAIPKGGLASGVVREAAESAPIRAYRGKPDAEQLFPEPQSPANRRLLMQTGNPEIVWGSSSPDVAGTYAGIFDHGFGVSSDDLTTPFVGAMAPMDLSFENPMRVDAQGRSWNNIPNPSGGAVPVTTDTLANIALQRGHDGLVVENVLDRAGGKIGEPATTYAALKRGTVTSPLTGETLFSDTGKPSLMGSAIAGAEKPQGFDVWHGSPHDFDKFDISKIGSGEGAQAFGHGLYFAENPKVAKGYQESLSNDYGKNTRTLLRMTGGDADAAREWLARRGKQDQFANDILDDLNRGGSFEPGYLYQAHINANPEDFLSLEGRFGGQSPTVQNALTAILAERQPQLPIYPEYPVEGLMGVARMRDAEIASALRDQGVPGLSYFDAGSRTAKEGSRNYVLFSDDPVDILHKWRGDTQLYSDQLPSLFGSALSPYTQEPRNSLFNY